MILNDMIDNDIQLAVNGTFDLENMRIYFWKGIFSQWHRCPIYDPIHNVTANCAEQLMMANKAWLFGDHDAAQKILNEDSPKIQKQIGREVRGYDDSLWSNKRLDIVSGINYLKFSQNKKLLDILIRTKDFELVEASPVDKIWGVGLHESDPRILNKSEWQGLNLLGQAIMNCRNRLLYEHGK